MDEPTEFEKLGSLPISRRTPEERSKEEQSIMNWLRNSKDPSNDTPNGDFQAVDQLLPTKERQSDEERARDLENVLDYCRNLGVKPTDDEDVAGFSKLGSIPVSRKSNEDRQRDINDILQWIRNGQRDSDDPTGEFAKIQNLLPSKGNAPEEQAEEIESYLDYFRNKGEVPMEENDMVLPFSKLGIIPVTRKTPEERQRDVDNCLRWIRAGKPDDSELAKDFKKIDNLLPERKGQTPINRARDIESALDWSRTNGIPGVDETAGDNFASLPSVPVSRRSPAAGCGASACLLFLRTPFVGADQVDVLC